jgi:hypothetical protein
MNETKDKGYKQDSQWFLLQILETTGFEEGKRNTNVV